MKKIIIITEGKLGDNFVGRIAKAYPNDNVYDIVCKSSSIKKSNEIFCRYYYFDPTSRLNLSKVISKSHILALIVLKSKDETVEVYRNLRRLHVNLQIVIADFWNLNLSEDNLTLIDTNSFLVNKFFSMLPDVPVFAQQVGLGKGDITEVVVPFGSAYAYRHISNIEQKNWRIGAIYRKNQILLPKPYLMIRPNDILLLIGQPIILKEVYRAIKREHGQFPAPYGKNILHIIDMKINSFDNVKKEIEQSIYMHKRLKDHFLFIKIINPNHFGIIKLSRDMEQENVKIVIEYEKYALDIKLEQDVQQLNVGLIIVNRFIFAKRQNKIVLHSLKKPILKLGEKDVKKLKKSAIILNENKNIEVISSTIFDISTQIALSVGLYDIDPEGRDKSHIVEHFENLAEIYAKKIDIIKSNKNPLRQMQDNENFLHFIPFTKNVVNSSIIDLFFPNVEKLYQFLDDYNQIFIPVL